MRANASAGMAPLRAFNCVLAPYSTVAATPRAAEDRARMKLGGFTCVKLSNELHRHDQLRLPGTRMSHDQIELPPDNAGDRCSPRFSQRRRAHEDDFEALLPPELAFAVSAEVVDLSHNILQVPLVRSVLCWHDGNLPPVAKLPRPGPAHCGF